MVDKQQKVERARELFLSGYNCAQSVAAAFAPKMGLSEQAVLRLASAFGGGLGGMRLTCGAVSGMCMALGQLTGYDDADDPEAKKHLYAQTRRLCEQFLMEYGTLTCRELLAQNGVVAQAEPSERTPEYYRTRPCVRYVEHCAALLSDALNEANE